MVLTTNFTVTPIPNASPRAVYFQNLQQFNITLTQSGTGNVLLSSDPMVLTINPSPQFIYFVFYHEVQTGITVTTHVKEIVVPYTQAISGSTYTLQDLPLAGITPNGTIKNMSFRVGVAASPAGPPFYTNLPIATISGTFVNCLLEGTMIKTPKGLRAIETIQEGEEITGPEGKPAKVLERSQDYVKADSAHHTKNHQMYRIGDVVLSYWHKVLQDGKWKEAHLVGTFEPMKNDYVLYHLKTEHNTPLVAGSSNLVVESWAGVKVEERPAVLPPAPVSLRCHLGFA